MKQRLFFSTVCLSLCTPTSPQVVRSWRGLQYTAPYPFTYQVHVKQRWCQRALPEVFAHEFYGTQDFWIDQIQQGKLLVNGDTVSPDCRLRPTDVIFNTVHFHEAPVSATDTPHILDEHPDWVAVYKPAGIPTHASGHFRYHALTEWLSRLLAAQHRRPAPQLYTLYRLDRVTSGVVVFAKNVALAQQWHQHASKASHAPSHRKVYVARVQGRLLNATTCSVPLRLDRSDHGCARSYPEPQMGKPSETHFRPLGYDPRTDTSLVECLPITGRTHQIRAHLHYLGHPVANDALYGGKLALETMPSQVKNTEQPPLEVAGPVTEPTLGQLFPGLQVADPSCHHCPYAAPTRWREDPLYRQQGIWLHALSYRFESAPPLERFCWSAQADWPSWAQNFALAAELA
jgi:RluA family pseudouridine synthase